MPPQSVVTGHKRVLDVRQGLRLSPAARRLILAGRPLQHRCLLLIIALMFAACGVPPEPPRPTRWGQVYTLAYSEQADAPALWASSPLLNMTWIAITDFIHQDMQQWREDDFTRTVALRLPSGHPFSQTLLPGGLANTHLLWLDSAENDTSQLRLYGALVPLDMDVARGRVRLSDRLTLRYTAVTDGGSGLWVVWSGGRVDESALFSQRIDAQGRPLPPVQIVSAADWPALIRANDGRIWLFWIEAGGSRVFRALYTEGTVTDTQAITSMPALNPGDRLDTFRAALDNTHVYLFWNITRLDGSHETWWTSAPIAAARWSQAGRLGLLAIPSQPMETGYNTGIGERAVPGESWASWTIPLHEQAQMLPAAAQVGLEVGVIFFQAGELAGYQGVVSLAESPTGGLLGSPSIATDRDRHLYVGWAEPTEAGYAELNMTSTRRR